MKGIMVTLLMLITTGIVVGQQSNSSNNSFGSSSRGEAKDLVKPLEIGVSEDAMRGIRNGRILVSKVEPVDPVTGETLHRNVISGISLFPEGRNFDSLAKTTVVGQDDGDGVLRFALTDAQLNALENNQLNMEFDASQRGRYQEIEVYYAGSGRSASSQQPRSEINREFTPTTANRPRNQVSQRRSPSPFGPRSNQTSQTPFIPSPGPAEPGEINFMGPALPTSSPGSWTPPTRTTQRNPALDPNRQNRFTNERSASGWNIPEENENSFRAADRQNDRDTAEARWIAERQRQQQQQDYENEMRRQQDADRIKRLEEERLARSKWGYDSRDQQPQTPLAPILHGPSDDRARPTPDQIAYQEMLRDLEQRERLLQSRENSLHRKSDLLAMKENQLLDASLRQQMWSNVTGNRSLRANQPQDTGPDWDRRDGLNTGMHYLPVDGPVTERSRHPGPTNNYPRQNVNYPDSDFRPTIDNKDIAPRVQTNSPRRGINNYVAALPPPGANKKPMSDNRKMSSTTSDGHADRVHGFVLFLLLCSLGLNIYLAFISRGFYVRYHELADELRDTFSTTH